ncbi:MAG: polysaccharide biosynthesis protein [Lachnospiraceae bacterium]|nr:polysaccharide biosynthesis protein [Lachnospiraceae bacterium]
MREAGKRKIQHWQLMAAFLAVFDALTLNLSFFLALWLRFDCRISMIPSDYWQPYIRFTLIYMVLGLLVYWKCGLYSAMWRYASFKELERIVLSGAITFLIHIAGISFFVIQSSDEFWRMPWTYYVVGIMFQFNLTMASRFSYRFLLLVKDHRGEVSAEFHPVLLIGAGSAGRAIVRQMNRIGRGHDRIACIIDDDTNKWKRYLDGIPILGGRELILSAVERYHIEKIYIAIPSATADELKEILNICKETDCSLKLLRGMYQMVDEDRITVRDLKDVSIEDLLGRDPIRVEMKEIYDFINGRVILVTGGGGSIGSELCRQIAKHAPKTLIIFDVYENNAYEIQQELKRDHPELDLQVVIGSVRDSRRLKQVFEQYRPQLVYHAAAHKHVPLMEESPAEAVKNNAVGTYKTAYAAMCYGVDRFVLISTDKAVNPTNIMGASKRLCEMVVQSFDAMIKAGRAKELKPLFTHEGDAAELLPQTEPHTEYVAVRFGNVLGSNGSVVPLFKEQIAQGGPVTVTHPDIIRYFMTIPEAVSLVLQAGTYAKGGEIFVLDMGSPVKIDTLARNLIRLSGLKPDEDIKIVYTGLRPGEKMYEEKLMEEEGLTTTPNKLIHVGKPVAFDEEHFLAGMEKLTRAAYEHPEDIRRLVSELVDTYHYTASSEEEK